MTNQHGAHRSVRAAQVYRRLLRLYPRAYRQQFSEQMLQTFRDHYRDTVEVDGESAAQFWLQVIGDEGKSIAREYLATLAERIWPMQTLRTILAAPFVVWRGRQTRNLA